MIQVGVNPIAWSNGDFPELGDGMSFSRCLSEIRQAGYVGTELGHGFPTEPEPLRAALDEHGLALVSGWYPSHVLARTLPEEERAFLDFARFLRSAGGRYAVVAEATHSVQRRKDRALQFGAGPGVLRPESWDRLAHGIERLASLADDHGIDLVYHPHMGTVVQEETQVAELVLRTSPRVRLTADTGHIRFAGDDPVAFLERYLDRVGLVHLKDVRLSRVERFSAFRASFYQAVVGGVFTVPGDGDLDFDGIFDVLRRRRYDGWVIVEAEQDPEKADPLVYSTKGRDTVRAGLGV